MTPASYGHSPRAQILADLTLAWAARNAAGFVTPCRDNAAWHRVGSQPVHGHPDIREAIEARPRADTIGFDTVITHGRSGMCSGTITLVDATVWAFCHVVHFASTAKTALITQITTFEIPNDAANT